MQKKKKKCIKRGFFFTKYEQNKANTYFEMHALNDIMLFVGEPLYKQDNVGGAEINTAGMPYAKGNCTRRIDYLPQLQ